jgi:hypothetical protein
MVPDAPDPADLLEDSVRRRIVHSLDISSRSPD